MVKTNEKLNETLIIKQTKIKQIHNKTKVFLKRKININKKEGNKVIICFLLENFMSNLYPYKDLLHEQLNKSDVQSLGLSPGPIHVCAC